MRSNLFKCSHVKCLTQTKSPKHAAQHLPLAKQIQQLMKSSRERNTERGQKPQLLQKPFTNASNQAYQQSSTSRGENSRNVSLTFHQLLQEYNNRGLKSKIPNNKQKNKCEIGQRPSNSQLTRNQKLDLLVTELNKENSFTKTNRPTQKVRQISFPNSQLLNNSHSRTRIKESMHQIHPKKEETMLSKICNMAEYSRDQIHTKTTQFLQEIFRLSQESYECVLNMREIAEQEHLESFRKLNHRCVSADIPLPIKFQPLPKSSQKKSRSSSQDRKEGSRFYGSTQANSIPVDLTCDENVTLGAATTFFPTEERLQTEPDPLIQLERHYIPDPYYLMRQEEINWLKRAILIDWMMEVAMGFQLKRQTLHLGVYYVDCYLSKKQTRIQELQLVGLSALFIAQKIEEIVPKRVVEFEKAADHGYKVEQILAMEVEILVTLRWLINPPTYTHWVNWFTDQWDLYAQSRCLNCYFRKANEESYQMFRQLTQLVDCALLDITTLQYLPRTVVVGLMYLILAFEMEIFGKEMLEMIQNSSLYLIDQQNGFNQIFGGFVKLVMGCGLQDLLPAVQYVAEYMRVEPGYETPPGVCTLGGTHLENNYEEFLSFQSYSKSNMQFIRSKQRE